MKKTKEIKHRGFWVEHNQLTPHFYICYGGKDVKPIFQAGGLERPFHVEGHTNCLAIAEFLLLAATKIELFFGDSVWQGLYDPFVELLSDFPTIVGEIRINKSAFSDNPHKLETVIELILSTHLEGTGIFNLCIYDAQENSKGVSAFVDNLRTIAGYIRTCCI